MIALSLLAILSARRKTSYSFLEHSPFSRYSKLSHESGPKNGSDQMFIYLKTKFRHIQFSQTSRGLYLRLIIQIGLGMNFAPRSTAIISHPEQNTVCHFVWTISLRRETELCGAGEKRKRTLAARVASEIMNDTLHSVTIDGTLSHHNLLH